MVTTTTTTVTTTNRCGWCAADSGSEDVFSFRELYRANAGPERGLPVGNLTSQFFANVYLNELDQFVKHTLGCRYYCRYVDDFILLHDDPERLQEWREAIEKFLHQRLKLALKPGDILRPVSDGIDFLGYIVRRNYTLVRRRVVGNLRERLNAYAFQVLSSKRTGTGKAVARVAVQGYLKGGLKRRSMRFCWWPEWALMSAHLAEPAHLPRATSPILTGAIP